MPQHSYDIETKAGKFTIESDHELKPEELVQYADKAGKAAPMGVVKGVDEFARGMGTEGVGLAKDTLSMASGGGPDPASSFGGAIGGIVGNTVKEEGKGALQRVLSGENPLNVAAEIAKRKMGELSHLDPTGVSQALGHTDESLPRRAGRATTDVLLAVAPGAIGAKFAKMSKLAEAAKVAQEASEAAKLGELSTVTGTGMKAPPVVTPAEVPNAIRMPVPPTPAVSGTVSEVGGMRTTSPQTVATTRQGVTGPAIQMSVPQKPVVKAPIVPEAPVTAPVTPPPPVTPEVSEANLTMKAGQEAEGVIPPGREPAYGPGATERRAPTRAEGRAVDVSYNSVRKEIERKQLLAKARETLMGRKDVAPVATEPTATNPKTEPPTNNEDPLRNVAGTKAPETATEATAPENVTGFSKTKTVGLAEMKQKYGLAEAAKRAGMGIPEFEARLDAARTGKPVEEILASRVGADKTNRTLGTKLPSTGKIPQKAVEAIKAVVEKKQAAGTPLTDFETKMMARIKSEGGYGALKAVVPLGGAAIGGTLAAAGGNDDDKLGRGILGAVAGGVTGASLTNLPKAFRTAQAIRRELMLSGGAIPKNITQMAGNALYASAENKSLKPMKELFRLPQNFKEYASAMKEGDPYSHGTIEPLGPGAGKSKGRFFQPSHHIGAIDKTDVAMLKRSGVADADIPRYMMNADQDVLRAITNHPDIPEALRPTVKVLARVGFPFTRFATNQLAGTAREVAQVIDSVKNLSPNMRTALNLGATGGGVAIGKWAGNDPKKRLIAAIAMPLFGPSQGVATLAAIASQGARGLGGGAFGGLSPMPEEGLNPAQFADPKRWFGFKPAVLSVAEKMSK